MREIIQSNRVTKKPGLLDPRLVNYVAQCRKMRITDEEIRRKLLKVGWQEEEADRVLGKAETETNISFLSPSAKPVPIEKINLNEAGEDELKNEFIKGKKRPSFFRKKNILIFIILILFLAGVFWAGYYFIFRKTKSSFWNKNDKESYQEVAATNCGSKEFTKPESTGSAVLRIDSTMKLLINAIGEKDYCLTMSLFSDDSKDKHRELIKIVIEDEDKRNKFLDDLDGYMIPAIDENDPSSEAKATITKTGAGGSSTFLIIFSKKENGEYLISSM